jgi:hypothetical protein
MTMSTRTKVLLTTARETSWAVRAFLATEAIVILGLALAAVTLVAGIVKAVAIDGLPPWRALIVLPAVGAAAELVRATRPVAALRRWHGVLIRRIDERWGNEA